MRKGLNYISERLLELYINKEIIFLLTILSICTLFPILGVGFTTNDDLQISTGTFANYNQSALLPAKTQGRLGLILGMFLLRIPYLFENSIYFHFIRIGSIILMGGALGLFTKFSFRSRYLAVLVTTFFFAFAQNSWDHNALTSYPFAMNFTFICFLSSLGFFIAYYDEGKSHLAIISSIFYTFTLANESFVLYWIVFAIVSISFVFSSGKPSSERAMYCLKPLKYLTIALVLYLILFFAWKYFFPGSYSGTKASVADLRGALSVVWHYSISSFPVKSIELVLRPDRYTDVFGSSGLRGVRFVLSEMRVEWLIKSLISFVLTVVCLRGISKEDHKIKKLSLGILLAVICIFLPNLLLGLVQKYRDWVAGGGRSYLYTYYSFLSLTLFLALAFVMGVGLARKRVLLKRILIFAIALFVSLLTLVVDVNNFYITFDQKMSHEKWLILDEFLDQASFRELTDSSIIYAPSLFNNFRGIVGVNQSYWTDYVFRKTGKGVRIISKLSELDSHAHNNIYFLKFDQEPHSLNSFLLFGAITDLEKTKSLGVIFEKEVTIFSLSYNKHATLIGSWGEVNKEASMIWVDNQLQQNMHKGIISLALNWAGQTTRLPSLKIKSNSKLNIENFTLAYYPIVPDFSVLITEFGEGFYGVERSPGVPDWRWSSGEASLRIINTTTYPKDVVISMKLESLDDRSLYIEVGDFKKDFFLKSRIVTALTLSVPLKTGVNGLRIYSKEPGIYPNTIDRRLLAFRISQLEVTN